MLTLVTQLFGACQIFLDRKVTVCHCVVNEHIVWRLHIPCFSSYFLLLTLASIDDSCPQQLLWQCRPNDDSLSIILSAHVHGSSPRQNCCFSPNLFIYPIIYLSMDSHRYLSYYWGILIHHVSLY